MNIRLPILVVVIFFISNFGFASTKDDWSSFESADECLIFTTEDKRGNLDYPSNFFFIYNSKQHSVGTAVQNFEWLLKQRQSKVSFSVDGKVNKSLNANLRDNIMAVNSSDVRNTLISAFKKGNSTKLKNSKGHTVATFSLMGFTKAYEKFSQCIERKRPVALKKVTKKAEVVRKKPVVDSQSKEILKFVLKTAALFALLNSDIPIGSYSDGSLDLNSKRPSFEPLRPSDRARRYLSESNNYNRNREKRSWSRSTNFRNIGNTVRSSDGTTFRQVGNTIRSSDGTTFRQVGNTIRSSDGESWRWVGNTLRSSSGTTWRMIGDTWRSSDGTTCRDVGTITRCSSY